MGTKIINLTNLNAINWNANGIKSKRSSLIVFMAQHNIHIACITETHLIENEKFTIPGYSIYRFDRDSPRASGGVAIIIKKDISHYSIYLPAMGHLEVVGIKLALDSHELIIYSAYHAPRFKFSQTYIDRLFDNSTPTILLGDLNCKHEAWGCVKSNPNGKRLLPMVNIHNLSIIAPDEPTHYSSNPNVTPDILDIGIFQNSPMPTYVKPMNELDSDHLPVFITFSDPSVIFDSPEYLIKGPLDWELFKSNFINHFSVPTSLYSRVCIDEAIVTFNQAINLSVEMSTIKPYSKRNKLSNVAPPNRILELIRLKNKHRRLWQQHRLPHLRRRYNQLNRRVKWELDNHRFQSYNRYLSDLTPTNSSLWVATKRILKTKSPVPSLLDNGKSYDGKLEKANLLADYFQSAFTPNEVNDIQFDSDIKSKVSEPLTSAELPMKYTSPSEISYYIKTLKLKKAPGHDKIPNDILHNLPRKGLAFLSSLFNACLSISYFPKTWKHSEIIVIHKPGKPSSLKSSYRPISLLPTLSKLFEKVIKSRLEKHLNDISLIPPHQFGFKSHHSTCHQLLRVSEDIINGFENKQFTVAAFLDVAQAFDKVWHDGLLCKLQDCGTPLYLLNIIRSFLADRTFCVKLDNALSLIKPILAGVPQGAMLSPLLFSVYISDIPIPQNSQTAIYADDTLLYSSDSNLNVAINRLQISLDDLIAWYKKWRIAINATKSEVKIFTLRRYNEPPKLKINNEEISWNPSDQAIKYLGVYMDKKLNWKYHINKKLNLAHAQLTKLYSLLNKKSAINVKSGILIYKSILRPLLLYACPVWGTAASSSLNRLQVFQNKILRIILKCPWYVRNNQVHHELGVSSIFDYIKALSRKFFNRLPNTTGITFFDIGNASNLNLLRLKPRLPQDLLL